MTILSHIQKERPSFDRVVRRGRSATSVKGSDKSSENVSPWVVDSR